jgi:crotonobetaine/carnitine-CoA ligase
VSSGDERILAHLIANQASSHPTLDVLTFVHIDSAGRIAEEIRTYQDLWNNGRRLSGFLFDREVTGGKRFAIMMANHPEFVELMIASSITASIYVPIDPRTKGEKLKYMLMFTECSGVVCADYALPALLEIVDDLVSGFWIAVVRTGKSSQFMEANCRLDLAACLQGPIPENGVLSVDVMAPMQMLFTSGTTGDPKAILSPHNRFAEIGSLAMLFGFTPWDRPYTGLSLSHSNAQMTTLGFSLRLGMRAVFSRTFTKSRMWEIIRKYQCTVFNILGGMATAIYAEPRREDDADNPVRYVLSAGMPPALWEDFRHRFGVDIYEWYGQSEGVTTLNPPRLGPKGSVGKAPPYLILAVLDEHGEKRPAGEEGEIAFRRADGSPMPLRYYKNEAATSQRLAGGWLRTGDLGHLDENGWLFFHARRGGSIRRNGDFIHPGYIEKVLAESPMVREVFVYGIPARSGAPGESDVVAAVVSAAGAECDPQALFALCRMKLEANFVPSYLQVVDEIPKTASEKPQERFLKELLLAGAKNVFGRAP